MEKGMTSKWDFYGNYLNCDGNVTDTDCTVSRYRIREGCRRHKQVEYEDVWKLEL